MLSHHKFLSIMSFIVISVVVGGAIIYWQSRACTYTDPQVCAFITTLKPETFEQSQGVFTTRQGVKSSQVSWALDKESKQIRVMTDEVESMHLIITRNTVFVKDYRDNLWWQQSHKEAARYFVNIAFDPDVFLSEIRDRFRQEGLEVELIEEVSCGKDMCSRYRIGDNAELVDIEQKTHKLARYAGQKDGVSYAFQVEYEPPTIMVPEFTKPAEPGQNIFLEQFLYQPAETPVEQLEFIQEFEREMKQK